MKPKVKMNTPLRATQRAPRSCINCSTRKVKCDRSVPCANCVRRGQPDTCVRETVLIRGQETTYRNDARIPTYQELSSENQRLRNEMDVLRSQADTSAPSPPKRPSFISSVSSKQKLVKGNSHELLEKRLWDNCASSIHRSSVTTWNDIIIPTRSVSERLVSFDKTWNSWVHYAVEYPQMSNECKDFLDSLEQGTRLHETDPSWLAVYFSILSAAALMWNDDEAHGLFTVDDSTSRNWYDAAIFCLHHADFMRFASIRSVQAIAILGMCFNNWGDLQLGERMLSCALQIAQQLGLNTPFSEQARKCLSEEGQHRLWWTLIICDWMDVSDRPLRIDHLDFDVPYPSAPPSNGDLTDAEDPVHYHIFMARAATALYYFRRGVRSYTSTLEERIQILRSTDEELAKVIDKLPIHLQPDSDSKEREEWLSRLELSKPWIKWQRFDLTLVLLHLRILINRTLSDQWTAPSSDRTFDWARTVCVRSALSLIWINKNWDMPSSSRKQWALSYHLFTSAIFLLGECQDKEQHDDGEYRDAIGTAIWLLERVSAHNAIAYHAGCIIREKLQTLS